MNHSSHNNNLEYGIKIDLENSKLAKDLVAFIGEILNEAELIYEKAPASKSATINHPTGSIQKYKEYFPKAYEKWTPSDDALLEKLFCDKKSIDEIAKSFMRQPSAIRSRINKLELYEKYAL